MLRTTLSLLSRRVMATGLAASAAVLLAACGSGDNSDDAGSMAGMDQGVSAPAAKSWNDADVQFAQMMIPDHEMVAQMAVLADKKATTAELKTLAKQMAGQTETVQMLTGMLTNWGKPASGDMAGMQMPGAMTGKDMDMLDSMRKGMEFDMMFAQMMVKHHQGSIQMAKDEQANGANAQAKAMAAEMEKTLTAQVAKLEKIADMS